MALLDLQGMEAPQAPSGHGGGGGGGGRSNASLLLPCSRSTISLLACYKED